MLVVCQHCGTKYDFEDTLVSPRGTTVQCMECSGIFVVFPEGRASSRESWLVRTESGEEIRFESLRPLQSRLQDGTISRLDRFSRDGKQWRRIADITELDEFMRLHASTTETVSPPGENRRAGATSSPPAASSSFRNPSKKSTVYGLRSTTALERPTDQAEASSLPVPDHNAIPRAPAIPFEASPFAQSEAAGNRNTQAPQASKQRDRESDSSIKPIPSIPIRASTEDDSEPVTRQVAVPQFVRASKNDPAEAPEAESSAPPEEESSRDSLTSDAPTAIVASASPILPELDVPSVESTTSKPRAAPSRSWLWVAAVGIIAAAVASWFWARTERPEDYQDVDALLARATVDDYAMASRQLTDAYKQTGLPKAASRRLSRVHALWGQALRLQSESQAPREVETHAHKALDYAKKAVLDGKSGDAEVLVALADAQRLSGDLHGAMASLERARRIRGELSSDFLYVRALLSADEAGSLAEARTDAQRAVETDLSNIAARIVLVYSLLERGDLTLAKKQLASLEKRAPDNPRVQSLFALVAQGAPQKDAGVPDATPNVDLSKGYRALESGQLAAAEEFFLWSEVCIPKPPCPLDCAR